MSSATDPDVTPRSGYWSVRRALRWMLGLQVVFALVLFSSDIARVLPASLIPSDTPRLTQPTAPGDQTRRYTPRQLPARDAPPGQRPLPSTADMPDRLDMEMTTWDGMAALTLTGAIAPGDAARFDEMIETADTPPEVVFLNSPGGSVGDALEIGRSLRATGATTRLTEADICLSACPYILVAGTLREVAPDAWVGVHQHYFGENTALPAFMAVADIQRGQGEVMAYLAEMDIDPLMMQPALMTPPEEIYLLTIEELISYRVIADPDADPSDEEGATAPE